jgi:hypothetical protein
LPIEVKIVSTIDSIIIAPGTASVTEVSAAGAVSIPIRVARRFDALAKALGTRLHARCIFAESLVRDWGSDTVLICRPDVLHELEQMGCAAFPRVVCIDLNRTNILNRVEALGLAAAVDVLDYAAWMRDAERPGALFGRKELVANIGAVSDTHALQSGLRYTRMTRGKDALPDLLADYLTAYSRAGFGGD